MEANKLTIDDGRSLMYDIVEAMSKRTKAEGQIFEFASVLWDVLPNGIKINVRDEGLMHFDIDEDFFGDVILITKTEADGVIAQVEDCRTMTTCYIQIQELGTATYCGVVSAIARKYLNQSFTDSLKIFMK